MIRLQYQTLWLHIKRYRCDPLFLHDLVLYQCNLDRDVHCDVVVIYLTLSISLVVRGAYAPTSAAILRAAFTASLSLGAVFNALGLY